MQSATPENIRAAAQQLREGNLVAFPTETVYGLGANACDDSAVCKIFNTKGRPSDNPLIVHVHSSDCARLYVSSIDSISEKLAAKFWPGPLTIVLPIGGIRSVSRFVTAGLGTVGFRVPSHPVALALLREVDLPIAAPSANKSGSPSPTSALHVFSDLGNQLTILNGGNCLVGLESTVVQVIDGIVHILRPGGVSQEDIQLLGFKTVSDSISGNSPPRAPGMKYRHYAPKAKVIPVLLGWDEIQPKTSDLVIGFANEQHHPCAFVEFAQTKNDLHVASTRLFDLLRHADQVNAHTVYIDCSFDREHGLGTALWNRISKAAQ